MTNLPSLAKLQHKRIQRGREGGKKYLASDMDATISEKNDFAAASSGSYTERNSNPSRIFDHTSKTFAQTSHSAELLVSPSLMDPLEDEYMMMLQC
jgi:hypothetical protein